MRMPREVKLFPLNDNGIRVRLFDKGTSTFFDRTATVTAVVKDPYDNEVLGSTASLVLIAGSVTGDFQGTIDAAGFNPPLGGGYTLHIVASQGNAQGEWDIPAVVKPRTGTD